MAALHREMVERRHWITQEQFGICYSLARVTPGTNVLAFCAGTAAVVWGWAGSVIAVVGASAPSAILAVWLVHAYEVWSRNAVVNAAVAGMVSAVVGLMVASALQLYRGQSREAGMLRGLALALTGGILLKVLGPLPALGIAALVGIAWREPA
jgi:chromate transporter